MTVIIACYNNARVELDTVQKSNQLCRQQQEHLSTQLQGKIRYLYGLDIRCNLGNSQPLIRNNLLIP